MNDKKRRNRGEKTEGKEKRKKGEETKEFPVQSGSLRPRQLHFCQVFTPFHQTHLSHLNFFHIYALPT